jgi:GH24 family phage-related lysozyme (muramidase)
MSAFFDSIENELDALDASEMGGPGDDIGIDYSGNPAVIRQIQAAINALGYQPALVVDGISGGNTKAGIQWLQTRAGLTVDGIPGDQTLGALGIAPPSGVSVEYAKGAAKQALAAIQQQFSPLFDWHARNPQPITQGKGVAPGFSATKASVVNSYTDWTTPLEGFLPFMYIDALGYVTTGMGNLIDPVSAALSLPWKHPNGSRASSAEIEAAWNAVDALRSDIKGQRQTSGPATQGGGSQGGYTALRITKADVQQLVASKLKSNEDYIMTHMPSFAKAPAPAQLAVHSMAWAMGPGFASTWPGFTGAFNQGDYTTAAAQSTMKGTGIDMRNMANKLLLTNAAQSAKAKKSPDTLYYIDNLPDLFTTSRWLIAGVIAGVVAVFGALAYGLSRGGS